MIMEYFRKICLFKTNVVNLKSNDIIMTKLVSNSDIKIDKAIKSYVSDVEKDFYIFQESASTYKNFLSNKMLIVHSIRRGLPFQIYDLIKERTPFKEEDWADFLGISIRTLQRNKIKKDFVFDSIQTEKIVELAEVTMLGKDVFDSKEQFYLWLNTPSFALGSLKPFDLLKDSYGKEMVMNELNKIQYGVFV